MEHKLNYRPDIDGLRAIAVLSVMGYHLKLRMFPGGFVGVDVFFVISGYLISAIILKDIHAGKFSIASFYERRVRRIFPALIGTLLGTAVLAYIYFLPTELIAFSKSLLSAVFSASNFYFSGQSGYFSSPIETQPLIHTWSLAVEEQFYIFLPIFLYLGHRYFRRRLRASVIVIAVVSFVISAVGAFAFPTSTFYLPHTRAWELLLGVLISMEAFPQFRGTLQRNLAALGGLALISLAVFGFTAYTPFPGAAALPPCLGTALIVAAGRSGNSWVGRALSLRPAVFVGLISYSLYLWHWPIIVFQGMEGMLVNNGSIRLVKLACIVVSFAVATISWRFVEMPFRAKHKWLPRPAVFKVASAAAVLAAAIGLTAIVSHGFPSRYPEKAIRVASYLDYDPTTFFRDGVCFISSEFRYTNFDFTHCLKNDPNKKNYLLIGDSHAAHLWYGLSTTLDNINILQATAAGCKPTIEQPLLASPSCRRLMKYVYTDYLPNHHVDRLLIAARWRDADITPVSHTLDWLKKRQIPVVLFGPMVQYDTALPRLLAFSIDNHDPKVPDEHRVDLRSLDRSMDTLATQKGVTYVSFYQSLCGEQSCAEFGVDGVPLLYDYGHLTKEGSLLVAQRLRENGDLGPTGTPQEAESAGGEEDAQ